MEYTPIGGSRSDGTVTLALQHGALIKPQVTPGQAQQVAADRCAAWGYSGAQAFGGGMRSCIASDAQMGCTAYQETVNFQCTGSPSGK